ncbi:MAG: radical SAM protein [Candidatus Hodarchaeota archaeon]
MKILEINSIRKDLRNKIKFALCVPSIYRVGMSSLAMHTIYNILNSYENVCCERVFLPIDNSTPYSLESNQPLEKFDFIAFSLHYEINYTNLLKILLKANIPIYSKSRNSTHPILIAGGPLSANPLPLSSFIDLFVIGDFEPVAEQILNIYENAKDKQEFLEQCADLPGFYVPKYTASNVKKIYDKNLDNCPHSISQIISQVESNSPFFPSLGKSFLLEISRGCNRGCRFCLIGFQGRPIRFRSFKQIQQIVSVGIENTKLNKVSLIGSGLSDHPNLEDICWYIVNNGFELSLPSLRVDCITDDLLQALKKGHQNSLTLAPEVGSERLLKVIHKGFSINDVLTAINNIKQNGIMNLKLYFMINLPTETSDDVNAIGDLVQKVMRIGFKGSNLKLSINSFIPKPHTPFQWETTIDLDILRNKIKELKKIIKVKTNFLDPRWARIQTYLSLGDKKFGDIISMAAKLGGSLGAWNKALKDSDFTPKTYKLDFNLPWDFIELEIRKRDVLSEYLAAI